MQEKPRAKDMVSETAACKSQEHNFIKTWDPTQYSRRHCGDTKQFQYWGPTHVMSYHTKSSRLSKLVPGICANLMRNVQKRALLKIHYYCLYWKFGGMRRGAENRKSPMYSEREPYACTFECGTNAKFVWKFLNSTRLNTFRKNAGNCYRKKKQWRNLRILADGVPHTRKYEKKRKKPTAKRNEEDK